MDGIISNFDDNKAMLIEWNPSQMETMKVALSRYQQKLQEKPSTPPINQEREVIRNLRNKLKTGIQACEDEGDTSSPRFIMDDYLFLCDLLHKYWGAQKQEYEEKANLATVEGELYFEEKELEKIREIMLAPIFMELDKTNSRRKLLVDSLYIMPELKKQQRESSSQSTTYIQKIENNYGQAVASNQGIMNQTNNPEITETLKTLIAKVLESDIPDEEKSEYVADLEIMKEESGKKNPDKKLFELKMPTIERLAAHAQIASLVHQVLPTIQNFVGSLF